MPKKNKPPEGLRDDAGPGSDFGENEVGRSARRAALTGRAVAASMGSSDRIPVSFRHSSWTLEAPAWYHRRRETLHLNFPRCHSLIHTVRLVALQGESKQAPKRMRKGAAPKKASRFVCPPECWLHNAVKPSALSRSK
jgi:hypothetical protein